MTLDGISMIAVIAIASFAIDRTVTATLFLLSFVRPWARLFPDPALAMAAPEQGSGQQARDPGEGGAGSGDATIRGYRARRRQRLAFYVLAAFLGGVVLAWLGEVTIFRHVGFTGIPRFLDCVMTGLILVAGADRSAGIIRYASRSALERTEGRPVEVRGHLTFEGANVSKEE